MVRFSSLILSEIAPNVRFREAKFQNLPGEHAPGPPSVLAPPVLDPLSAGSTLNCFHRSCSDAKNVKECQIEIDSKIIASLMFLRMWINLLYVILV